MSRKKQKQHGGEYRRALEVLKVADSIAVSEKGEERRQREIQLYSPSYLRGLARREIPREIQFYLPSDLRGWAREIAREIQVLQTQLMVRRQNANGQWRKELSDSARSLVPTGRNSEIFCDMAKTPAEPQMITHLHVEANGPHATGARHGAPTVAVAASRLAKQDPGSRSDIKQHAWLSA